MCHLYKKYQIKIFIKDIILYFRPMNHLNKNNNY